MLRIVEDADTLAPGVTVAGKYTLERVVGEGGMGVVWAARHVVTHKACALKFLKERRAQDPKSHERLLREARAACTVRHPHVASVHDLLELPSGAPFIVMDLLEGESLARRIAREGSLAPKEAIAIVVDTMDAVIAAHAHGIIHRDLKPENVFLDRDGVKVLDFGIAKLAEAAEAPEGGSSSLTSTLAVLGTPKYMAPEQVAAGEATFASDVWALGMIAFECLVGTTPPALGEARRAERIRRALVEAHLDPKTASVIAAMLDPDLDGRPALREARAVVARARLGRKSTLVATLAGASVAAVVVVVAWRASSGGSVAPTPSSSIAPEALASNAPSAPAPSVASSPPPVLGAIPSETSARPKMVPSTRPPALPKTTSVVTTAAPPPSTSAAPKPSASSQVPTHVRD